MLNKAKYLNFRRIKLSNMEKNDVFIDVNKQQTKEKLLILLKNILCFMNLIRSDILKIH